MEDTFAEKLVTIAENEQNVFNAGYEKGLASGGVPINNQDKTITENGVYQADKGYTGLGTVTVEVASTGGGDIDALIDKSITEVTSNAVSIGNYAFYNCLALKTANFPLVTKIDVYAFYDCKELSSFILRSETICKLSSTLAFNGSSIASGTGYIYVPKALVESYKAATNWSNFATQFRALEDYTVDGTINGELDESKI